ncbi:pectate lyase [Uliginosibacterium sp. H1]|uniref:pectate lyase n=1 Tax=Uliginosibacterium sp. H1 TaxID=3114757 RepID=UPI002E193134|nr:pectate lyase [Uliginosibacterium sp. H1]
MMQSMQHPSRPARDTGAHRALRSLTQIKAILRHTALGLCVSLASATTILWSPAAAAQTGPGDAQVKAAMKKATEYMTEDIAYKGGFVWSYQLDGSRRFGEMEAYPSMIWMQPPGTATVGHLLLDAYHATGDDYYYRRAEKVAFGVVQAQHPAGGWNYMYDAKGEASIKKWYETIGQNGWRLEEFFHYYGNATFDDAVTSEAAMFLLRFYLEKRDARFKAPLDKVVDFILAAQYPSGGYPQRFPKAPEWSFRGKPDYTGYITLNDNVAQENIEFLVMVYQTLGYTKVLDPINRAMNVFLNLQQPQPQPGFSLQYTPDLRPAGARSYEPLALATHTTAAALSNMMTFYELTGRRDFLARIPEALNWLNTVRLAPDVAAQLNRTHPTFIEIGTNRHIYVHRTGSNVVSGYYYADYDITRPITHYNSFRTIDLNALWSRYNTLSATTPEQVRARSPLYVTGLPLPRYFTLVEIEVSDLNNPNGTPIGTPVTAARAQQLIDTLQPVPGSTYKGRWVTPLTQTSNPYIGPGPATPTPGDYSQTLVGDKYDTSPFNTTTPVQGISTQAYITYMGELIRYLVHP